MTLSQQIAEDINKAEKENDIDPDGKLRDQVNEATDEGDFKKARRLNEKIADNEKDQELRGVGEKKDRRSVKDIAKEEGIDTFRKSNDQIREEILKKREEENKNKKTDKDSKNRQKELKPGKEGEKDKPKDNNTSTLNTISKAVEAIKTAVESLEKKLPQPALGY